MAPANAAKVASGEVMHILSGACSFTPTAGEPVQIGAGDTLFFPANTTGVWDIRETVRKVYVLVQVVSGPFARHLTPFALSLSKCPRAITSRSQVSKPM